MAWAKNGTPDTLSGTADAMTISDLTAKKFNVFLFHTLQSGANSQHTRYNNNSNSVYAERRSNNGAADSTDTSITEARLSPTNGALDVFGIIYNSSISGEEKLGISFEIDQGASGATTAPNRKEEVHKFAPIYAQPSIPLSRYIDSTGKTRIAIKLGANSELVGVEGTSVSFWLVRYNSPTGTAYLRVYDSDGSTINHTFGSIDVSTIVTSPATKYTFNTGSYTFASGDYITFEYTGGNASNGVFVYIDVTNPYDGTNTYVSEYSSTWTDQTGWDIGFEIKSPDTGITRVDMVNINGGGYEIGSNLSALTGDETETVTLQDGTIFEETDTNKAYIWSSSSKTWTQL